MPSRSSACADKRVDGVVAFATLARRRLFTVSFFFARSLLTRETTSCAPSTVSTESLRPPNHPIPLVQRVGAVFLVTFLIYA